MSPRGDIIKEFQHAIYDDDKSCRASLGLDGAEPRPHTVLVDYCWPSFSKNKQIDSIPR